MRRSPSDRLPASGALGLAVGQVVALGAALLVVEVALLAPGPREPFATSVAFPVTAGLWLGAGALAWLRRPGSRIGPLLCAGGILWLLAGLVSTPPLLLTAIGIVVATVPVAVVLHLLLAFPSGRLRGRASRRLAAAAYLGTTVLQAPFYLFITAAETRADLLRVADRPDLFAAGTLLQGLVMAVVIVWTAVVLVRRLRAAPPSDRRVLAPLYGYGVGAILVVTLAAHAGRFLGLGADVVFYLQVGVMAGIPLAFAAGVLRGGFARTAAIEQLGAWLARDDGLGDVGEALARTLGDPSLRLLFRSEGRDGWVDGDAHAVDLPADRDVVAIELSGRTVGAIVHDASLQPDPETVQAAGRVVAIAVDRERLTRRLLAEQEQLRESRTRLVEAGDGERRRLARELHDRLQGRLVLLALRIGTLRSDGPEQDMDDLRRDIDDVATELRRVLQGLMPALLIERGLSAAVEDVLARTPLRTDLRIDDDLDGRRLPPAVETTAFHVVSEAVTNTVKHAEAERLSVRMSRRDDVLHVEITDDGTGGARPGDGSGLRGITDRVDGLGGRVRIDSPPGDGTRLCVEIPCAS